MPASSKKARKGAPTSPRRTTPSRAAKQEKKDNAEEDAPVVATPQRRTRSSTPKKETVAPRSSSRRRRAASAGNDVESEKATKTPKKNGDGEDPEAATAAPVILPPSPTGVPRPKSPATPSSPSKKRKTKRGSVNATPQPKNSPSKSTTTRASKSPSKMDVDSEDDDDHEATEQTNNNTNAPSKTSSPKKQHPPTMDVKIHRLRHLDYSPSQVLAMTATTKASSYVALSRANGSVELLEATAVAEYSDGKKRFPRLFPLATIPGSQKAVAHSLCWVETATRPACVAAGPDGTLWTVHFWGEEASSRASRPQLRSRITSGGGGVFDLATCKGTDLPLVAGACQDGSIRIWQVSSQKGTLIEPAVATLTTSGAAILSVAWRCVGQQAGRFETEVYAGVADGTIRKHRLDLKVTDEASAGVLKGFEAEDGDGDPSVSVLKQKSVLRMTVESRGRRTATRVWTMQSLGDKTLATGNSLGQVQIWDTITGTLVQSINQTELKADVLKLVVNPSETKLFASGVDARVMCLERKLATDSQWKFTTAQRPHTHDVKSMVIVEARNPSGSVSAPPLETLVTGGVDTKLCTYIASDFSKRRPQVWYPWPCKSPIATSTSAPSNQLLSIQRENHIELYRLDKTPTASESVAIKKPSSEMVGEIAIETQSNLVTSAMSNTGRFLAVCNASMLFVFQLSQATGGDNDDMDVEPQKISLPKSLERVTAVALHFHETTLFVADSSSRIHVVDVSKDDEELAVSTVLIPAENQDGSERLPIHTLKTSKNGEYLVAMSKSSGHAIHLFKRSSIDLSYSHYWTLPSLDGVRPAATTLLDNGRLAVATVSFQIYVFDLEAKKMSPWSEKNGFPIQKWPSELSHRKDFPVRLTSNPINPSQLIVSSFGAFVVLNLDATLPKHCRMIPESHVRRRRKRSREEESEDTKSTSNQTKANPIIFSPPTKVHQGRPNSYDPNGRNCTICLYYNSMLHLDFMGSKEMIVVEQPWLRVISTFPDALQRRVYGCN